MDFHVLEGTALRTASSGTPGDGDVSAGEALFVGVVFAVAGDGCLAAVEERACGEVVGPQWPIPVSDIVFVGGVSNDKGEGARLRKVTSVSTLFTKCSLPEPDEMSMPGQEEPAVVSV